MNVDIKKREAISFLKISKLPNVSWFVITKMKLHKLTNQKWLNEDYKYPS